MEKKCSCGGSMVKSELLSFSGVSVRVPDGYNFPKDYQIIPFVCETCGKIELHAGTQQNGNFVFGGFIIG